MQSSSSSCAASERILALGHHNAAKEVGPLSPVNLDAAEEHIEKIEAALRTIKDRLAEVMKTCPLGAFRARLDPLHNSKLSSHASLKIQNYRFAAADLAICREPAMLSTSDNLACGPQGRVDKGIRFVPMSYSLNTVSIHLVNFLP